MFDNLFYKGISNFLYNFTYILLTVCNISIEINNFTDQFYNLGISNHVSELDVFILYVLFTNGDFKYKWISDKRFKTFPILGPWAKYNETIFISRNDGSGSKKIKKQTKPTDNVFIFPEGTLFYKPMIDKSNELCKKLNIKPYKNVLCPKENGFNTLLKILKPKYITDITLDYMYDDKNFLKKSQKPLTILELYKHPPKKIIITIDKIKVDSDTKINDIFRYKDKQLNNF